MTAYLTVLLRHRRPLSVSELAEKTGRNGCATGAKYGPVNRLVGMGLARWVSPCGHQRLAEPTPAGQRWNAMMETHRNDSNSISGDSSSR